jgi:hypothetical protein
VTLPTGERANPREIARSVALSGQFHDVVAATSKVLHGQDLAKDDRESLRWAKRMLQAAASDQVMVTMPAAQELLGPFNPILTLRKAGGPSDADRKSAFRELERGVTRIIRGERDEDTCRAADSIRLIFSMVSRMALQAELAAQGDNPPSGSWPTSLTTSLS